MSTTRTTIKLSPPCMRGALTVQLHDTWHVGVGKAQGRYLDSAADRDADGLPYVPGRTLKGLLRDAGASLEAWGHWPAGTVTRLFGSVSQREGEASKAGLIRVADARLPSDLRAWLASDAPDAGTGLDSNIATVTLNVTPVMMQRWRHACDETRRVA